jgi:hypothetical protein
VTTPRTRLARFPTGHVRGLDAEESSKITLRKARLFAKFGETTCTRESAEPPKGERLFLCVNAVHDLEQGTPHPRVVLATRAYCV